MPDISLRFHKDMLVLSAPVTVALERQGVEVSHDLNYLNLIEPEAIQGVLRLESIAGAQCLVANTEGITPARLAHDGLEERAAEIAKASLSIMQELRPQHVLAEIGPCGLPLDGSQAASLNENRSQYACAMRAFEKAEIDAVLLSGFKSMNSLKCALMGVRQVRDIPVFAAVDIDAAGMLSDGQTPLEEAVSLMVEFEASVVGFTVASPPEEAAALVARACAVTSLPLLVQLWVNQHAPKQGASTPENPYYCSDIMIDAATRLRMAGVQFLRAVGKATPAYTGALVAASDGFDVVRTAQEA